MTDSVTNEEIDESTCYDDISLPSSRVKHNKTVITSLFLNGDDVPVEIIKELHRFWRNLPKKKLWNSRHVNYIYIYKHSSTLFSVSLFL